MIIIRTAKIFQAGIHGQVTSTLDGLAATGIMTGVSTYKGLGASKQPTLGGRGASMSDH